MPTSSEAMQKLSEMSSAVAVLQAKEQIRDKRIDEILTTLDALNTKVSNINSTLSEAKGGWRVLMYIGGASGAVGAFISWAIAHLTIRGMP